MIEIKGNKKLFEKWNSLGYKIQLMRNIAQNDMEVSQEEIDSWFELVNSLRLDLYNLTEATIGHYNLKISSECLNKLSREIFNKP